MNLQLKLQIEQGNWVHERSRDVHEERRSLCISGRSGTEGKQAHIGKWCYHLYSRAALIHLHPRLQVMPLKTKYVGEIGDVVVGRITEVQQKRWKVETNSRLDSVLLLSSVNLPGGELRRRSAEDELSMRRLSDRLKAFWVLGWLLNLYRYLQEGDLISAEVQQLYNDGALSLHTRSLKYGKLSQGTLVKVSPSLIKRRKTHFHQLPSGVSVILGNNGYVWLSPTQLDADEGAGGGFTQNLTQVPKQDREAIARMKNCVLALSQNSVMLWDTTLTFAYETSLKYHLTELMRSDVMRDIANLTRLHVKMYSGSWISQFFCLTPPTRRKLSSAIGTKVQ